MKAEILVSGVSLRGLLLSSDVGASNMDCIHPSSVELITYCGYLRFLAHGAWLAITLKSIHSPLGEMISTAGGLMRVQQQLKVGMRETIITT